ncbi:MAG: hypothetical protein MI674_06880, partial [Cytophagales bacterium]|nr:hypothetical protein [Cytophagales bacterium]
TPQAANAGLVFGSLISLLVGILQLTGTPNEGVWPHFLLVSFYLFVAIVILVVFVGLTSARKDKGSFPSLKQSYRQLSYRVSNKVMIAWSTLFAVMLFLYLFFN